MRLDSNRALQILNSVFAAMAALDADRVVSHYTEDYVLELPYYKPGEAFVAEGRTLVHSFLVDTFAVQRMHLTIHHSHWIADESLVIAEYESKGEFLDNGDPYQNTYVGYWYFEGDRICRTREYYNPQAPRASAIG